MKRLHWFSQIILAEIFICEEIRNHSNSLMDPVHEKGFFFATFPSLISCLVFVLAKPECLFFYWSGLVWSGHYCFCLFCANCLALVFLIAFNGNFLGHCICPFHLGWVCKLSPRSKIPQLHLSGVCLPICEFKSRQAPLEQLLLSGLGPIIICLVCTSTTTH